VSAGLKRKIFRAPVATPPAWDLFRMAPATACLLLAMMVLHLNVGSWRTARPATGLDFTRDGIASAFSDHAQERENHLATVTFDWTNKGVIQSSIGSHSGLWPSTNFSN